MSRTLHPLPAAAFSGAHHTPGRGTHVANIVASQIDARDGLVDLEPLGQGLEASTDQGWRLHFSTFQAFQTETDFSIPQDKNQQLLTASTRLTTLLEQR